MNKALFVLLMAFFTFTVSAQKLQWMEDVEKGYSIPVGVCTWSQIQGSSFYAEDIENFYDKYTLESMNLADISRVCQEMFPSYRMKAVCYFGAWNNDCHEMLPAFIRWTESLSSDYNYNVDYTLVGVDRSLRSYDESYDVAGIHNVPTIMLTLQKFDGEVVVDEIELGKFSGVLKARNLEHELYLILARYLKYHPVR